MKEKISSKSKSEEDTTEINQVDGLETDRLVMILETSTDQISVTVIQ